MFRWWSTWASMVAGSCATVRLSAIVFRLWFPPLKDRAPPEPAPGSRLGGTDFSFFSLLTSAARDLMAESLAGVLWDNCSSDSNGMRTGGAEAR